MFTPRLETRDFQYFDHDFIALAHRGGSLFQPNQGRENTVHAFAEAAELGYRYFETDVHATSDGELIAFHDDRLDRVTDAVGLIAETPWSLIQRARINGTDSIPTLAELFETFPHARFNIDIKAPGAIVPLVRTINRFRAHDRVCVGSFGADRMRAFRRLMGTQVPTSVTGAGVAWTSFVRFLPRLLNDSGVVLQVPTEWPVRGRRLRIVTPGMLVRAHAAGKQVHVWTIDDAQTMHELIDLGVDGLVSDRIDVLKEVLIERGLWE